MSTVPAEIAGIGSTQQKLRVSPGFDPLKAAVGPEEYFVLSRIDGTQSLRDVLLGVGLPVERGIAIVTRLRSIGALLLPGETAAPSPAAMPKRMSGSIPVQVPAPDPSRPLRSPAGTAPNPAPPAEVGHDVTLPNPNRLELSALSEDVDLPEMQRRLILAIERLLAKNDPHAILGVPHGADAKTVKRAYFKLSKEIHPDRYYGKRLGSFAQRLALVFEATTRAYTKLTTPEKRPHKAQVETGIELADSHQPQTPQSYAAELFDRACQLEVSGDALEAMKLFAAAVRMDAQLKYLRRAASCALAARQPKSAVEYAKKAHSMSSSDPSSARLLAAAFRAAGKLSDAEEVLVMAMALKNENDTLMVELRNDLAELRRLMAQ